jgi:hypothetical protein
VGNYVLLRDAGQNTVLNTETGSYIGFRINNVDFGRLFPSGNWGLGTTTDGNFRLDIASSGSSGTLRAYDQTPTTGVTQLVVRAGAGQSTTNLLSVNNNANTNLFRVKFAGTTEADFDITRAVSVGPLAIASGSSDVLLFAGAGVKLALSMMMGWSGDGNAASATQVAVVRNSSTAIEVNNGTAGTFRDLYLRGVRPVGSTVANLPTAAGNTGMLATVTDANATTIGTTVAGGGSDTVLVWSNGTNWRIYAN